MEDATHVRVRREHGCVPIVWPSGLGNIPGLRIRLKDVQGLMSFFRVTLGAETYMIDAIMQLRPESPDILRAFKERSMHFSNNIY
jgi:hypothetical protein